MNQTIKKIKDGMIMWLWFLLIVSLSGLAYASLSWVNQSNVSGGETLTDQSWNDMLNNQAYLKQQVESISWGVPAWAVMAFNLASCPTWWSKANGTDNTLDLRGEFIRWVDDGRGVDIGRVLASAQWDAIRNITGDFTAFAWNWNTGSSIFKTKSWAFWWATVTSNPGGNTDSIPYSSSDRPRFWLSFDASLVVPTANENRSRNVALLYCVKD